MLFFFFFQAEDGIRDGTVTGVQTCALPILKVAGRELPHLPRSYEEDGAAVEPVEDLPRELDGREGHGDGMAPYLGVRAHALGHREGLAHQRVEHGSHRAAGLREREGVFDLAEYLRLAQHHGVEARGDAEGVLHRLRAIQAVEERLERRQTEAAMGAHLAEGRAARLARRLGHAVDLDAIARGHDHDFDAGAASGQIGKDLAQLVLVDHELLAYGDRRRPVGQAGHEEALDHEPCLPWKSTPTPRVARSTQNPAMEK